MKAVSNYCSVARQRFWNLYKTWHADAWEPERGDHGVPCLRQHEGNREAKRGNQTTFVSTFGPGFQRIRAEDGRYNVDIILFNIKYLIYDFGHSRTGKDRNLASLPGSVRLDWFNALI